MHRINRTSTAKERNVGVVLLVIQRHLFYHYGHGTKVICVNLKSLEFSLTEYSNHLLSGVEVLPFAECYLKECFWISVVLGLQILSLTWQIQLMKEILLWLSGSCNKMTKVMRDRQWISPAVVPCILQDRQVRKCHNCPPNSFEVMVEVVWVKNSLSLDPSSLHGIFSRVLYEFHWGFGRAS